MPIFPCRACGRDYVVGENEPAGLCPTCRDVSTVLPTLADAPAPPTLPPGPPPLSAFPTLPGYEILGELGRGGMGVVYKAKQVALNRIVALKVILVGAHASTDERARFRNEAEMVARLHHPNTVQVYELGEWPVPGTNATTPFLSLEFCGGGSLDKRLRSGPLPPQLAAGLIECLARAIHDAHGKQVVHRDLKPANILFDDKGVPKIADFGMAKKLDQQGHTKTGTVMGTPSYMAPEQASGKVKQTGPATDIYALGAILYECLTGRPPFRGETPLDTILAVVSDPVPVMAQTIPPALNAICQRCLRKNPEERYPSALALADDLRRYLGGQRVAAFVVPKEREKRSPKYFLVPGVIATLAILAVAVGGVYWLSSGEKESERKEGENRSGKNFEPPFRLPDALGVVRELKDCPKGVNDIAFASDGRHLVSGGEDGVVRVWDLQSEEVRRELKGHTGKILSVALSRDGERILTAGDDGTVRLWQLSSGDEIWRRGDRRSPQRFAVFLEGEREVMTCGEKSVTVWDAAKGKLARSLESAPKKGLDWFRLVVRPRTNQVLTIGMQGITTSSNFYLWDAGSGKESWDGASREKMMAEGGFSPLCAAFSSDGKWLISGERSGLVRLWDADHGNLAYTFPGHTGGVSALATAPEGARALSAGLNYKIRCLHLTRRSEEHVFTDQEGGGRALAFSPDGRHFASCGLDGTIRIWGLPPLKD
jgi:serine/threonine protein kinase